MKERRNDLQGIRGIAILAVIAYHLFPKIFQNGYLGVDQFFVLSGFLIAEILTREEKLTGILLVCFYYRRFKRILPLYVLCILLIIIYLLYFVNLITLMKNFSMALHSILCISNVPINNAAFGYEQQVFRAKNPFTHTWSLSLEIQFYILAPFIILFPIARIRPHLIAVIVITSYCLLADYRSLPSKKTFWAHGSLLTRIWQFGIGILCSYYSASQKAETDSAKKTETTEIDVVVKTVTLPFYFRIRATHMQYHSGIALICLIVSIVICFCPVFLPSIVTRLIICLITAYLIFNGSSKPDDGILSNPLLVHFGDVSYSLYLVHWPIIVYCKQSHGTIGAIAAGIPCSFLLSFFLTKLYERWYLEQSPKVIVSLTTVLYLSSFSFLLLHWRSSTLTDFSKFELPLNITTEEAIEWNIQSTLLEYDSLDLKECEYTPFVKDEEPPWTLCQIQNISLDGRARIMLVGNSYAANIARMFISLDECLNVASNIFVYSKVGCEVLEETDWLNECSDQPRIFTSAILQVKPDVLFITTRHLQSMESSNSVHHDNILEKEVDYLKEIEKIVTKKVYILNAFPRPVEAFSQHLIARLQSGIVNGQAGLTNTKADYQLARTRMKQLEKACQKCKLIDIMPTFLSNGTFQFYDEDTGLQYFQDGLHLSDYGLYKIAPLYREICTNIQIE